MSLRYYSIVNENFSNWHVIQFLLIAVSTKLVCNMVVCHDVKHHSIKVCPSCQLMQLPNFPLFSCSALLRWSNSCRSSKNHYKAHNVKLSFEGSSSIAIWPILSSISLGAILSVESRCNRTIHSTKFRINVYSWPFWLRNEERCWYTYSKFLNYNAYQKQELKDRFIEFLIWCMIICS